MFHPAGRGREIEKESEPKCRRRPRPRTQAAPVGNNDGKKRKRLANGTKRASATGICRNIFVAALLILVSERIPPSNSLVVPNNPPGVPFRFRPRRQNHGSHPDTGGVHESKNRHPASPDRNPFRSANQWNRPATGRAELCSSLSLSSITGLFAILDEEILEEEDGGDNTTTGGSDTDDAGAPHGRGGTYDGPRPKSPSFRDETGDDCGEGEEGDEGEDELRVSDAEALLACWSFLKRRKRLGSWNEHEERQSQRALSQNHFLTGDEALHNVLDDGDDEEDDDDDDPDENSASGNLLDNGNYLDFDGNNHDGEDGDGSMPTVQDILFASSYFGDEVKANSENDDYDDIAKDLITISNLTPEGSSLAPTAKNRRGSGGTTTTTTTKDIDLWYTEFTSFPEEPSDSRTKRVNAMKRRWEDPGFRERWYQKRWGSHSRKKHTQDQTDRERQAIQRARALPSGFLGSDELASMTEGEIAEAIRTRIESTQKRVERRRQTLQGRKDVLAEQIRVLENLADDDNDESVEHHEDEDDGLSRDVLFAPNMKKLEEMQRKRSERAKNLYATRLKNQKREEESKNGIADDSSVSTSSASTSFSKTKPASKRNKGPYWPPKQPTPQDAFLRIENDLDNSETPAIEDVRLVLEPGRMKNRKLLLRRILEDGFGLRGKCVPRIPNKDRDGAEEDDNGHSDQTLQFVTHSTIERLGTFIVALLKEKEAS